MKKLRTIVGDNVLKSAITSLQCKVWPYLLVLGECDVLCSVGQTMRCLSTGFIKLRRWNGLQLSMTDQRLNYLQNLSLKFLQILLFCLWLSPTNYTCLWVNWFTFVCFDQDKHFFYLIFFTNYKRATYGYFCLVNNVGQNCLVLRTGGENKIKLSQNEKFFLICNSSENGLQAQKSKSNGRCETKLILML